MLNWRQSTKNTKVELYSVAILQKTTQGLTQYSLNKDLQHLKWQQLKSWISSPDCQVALDKQQTQYQLVPTWKWKVLTNYWKLRNRNVQTFGFVAHSTNGQNNHGTNDPVVLIERNLYCHFFVRTVWEMQLKKVPLEHGVEKDLNWECLFVNRARGLSDQCMWTVSNWRAGQKT